MWGQGGLEGVKGEKDAGHWDVIYERRNQIFLKKWQRRIKEGERDELRKGKE